MRWERCQLRKRKVISCFDGFRYLQLALAGGPTAAPVTRPCKYAPMRLSCHGGDWRIGTSTAGYRMSNVEYRISAQAVTDPRHLQRISPGPPGGPVNLRICQTSTRLSHTASRVRAPKSPPDARVNIIPQVSACTKPSCPTSRTSLSPTPSKSRPAPGSPNSSAKTAPSKASPASAPHSHQPTR